MSTRKDFIRNMLMGFAVSLLPKPLLPSDSEVQEDLSISGSGIKINYDYGGGREYVIWASPTMFKKFQEELRKQGVKIYDSRKD